MPEGEAGKQTHVCGGSLIVIVDVRDAFVSAVLSAGVAGALLDTLEVDAEALGMQDEVIEKFVDRLVTLGHDPDLASSRDQTQGGLGTQPGLA